MTDNTAAPTAVPQEDMAKRVEQYITLRDKKTELKAKHKEELAPIDDLMETLESVFMQQLAALNADNLKTANGTVYMSTKKSASVADMDAFWAYIVTQGRWDLLDKKANVTGVEEFINDPANGGLPPPGVNWNSIRVPRVTKR